MTNTLVLDPESAEWLRVLQPGDAARDGAVSRLHALLLRTARGEAFRRRNTLPARVLDDLDHICVEAARDAVMAILAKFRPKPVREPSPALKMYAPPRATATRRQRG